MGAILTIPKSNRCRPIFTTFCQAGSIFASALALVWVVRRREPESGVCGGNGGINADGQQDVHGGDSDDSKVESLSSLFYRV